MRDNKPFNKTSYSLFIFHLVLYWCSYHEKAKLIFLMGMLVPMFVLIFDIFCQKFVRRYWENFNNIMNVYLLTYWLSYLLIGVYSLYTAHMVKYDSKYIDAIFIIYSLFWGAMAMSIVFAVCTTALHFDFRTAFFTLCIASFILIWDKYNDKIDTRCFGKEFEKIECEYSKL
jgi:hypothetical protein